MYKTMVISGLTVDPVTNSPIVILKEVDGDLTLAHLDRFIGGHCYLPVKWRVSSFQGQ